MPNLITLNGKCQGPQILHQNKTAICDDISYAKKRLIQLVPVGKTRRTA